MSAVQDGEGTRYFLLSWCSTGFECIQDITALHPDNWDKTQVMEGLRGKNVQNNPLNQQIFAMKMRAQMNTQRNYEIYVQTASDSITQKDLEEWAERDPQSLVNYVREYHYSKIYDDRVRKGSRVIE